MLPDLRLNLECFERLMAWDEELARRVASPKGTTEAGLAVLDREGAFQELIAATIDAARRRGAELAAKARGEQVA